MPSEREQAFEELQAACEPDSLPKLTVDELNEILDKSVKARVWMPNTFYKAGVVVYPSTRNGLKYRVTRSGTTGAVEPSWSTFGTTTLSGTVWLENDGEEYSSLYDIDGAIRRAWLKKASKASRFMRTGGMDMTQIQRNCLEMASRYETPLIG